MIVELQGIPFDELREDCRYQYYSTIRKGDIAHCEIALIHRESLMVEVWIDNTVKGYGGWSERWEMHYKSRMSSIDFNGAVLRYL